MPRNPRSAIHFGKNQLQRKAKMKDFGWRAFLAISAICGRALAAQQGVCDDPVNAGLPFCDGLLGFDARVDDLVARIPLTSVGGLLIDNSSALVAKDPPVRLPAYQWWNEALHGVGKSPGVIFQAPTPYATSYPQVIGVAGSFNRSLFYLLGEAIGTEARAFYNSGNSGLTYWAPNVNIYRDPRWGRGQETPGEDPFLTSEYAVAFVRGMQGDAPEHTESTPSNLTFLKVSATCKHFSSYSQEEPRHHYDVIVTKQDQADTYFPMFEACIKRGRATGVMCSYNAVNGIPSCADRELLTDVVRGQWGLDGYIMSDCGAVEDIISGHHYTQSPSRTCATALESGMDLNCGQYLKDHMAKALDEGVVKQETVRTALRRLFRMQMRLGIFEKQPQPFANIASDHVDTAKHHELALEASRQSIALLKNDDELLPLSPTKYGDGSASIALIGPHFNATAAFLGNYFGIPSTISTPLSGVAAYAKNVSSTLGCNISSSSHDQPDFARAEGLATQADQVVLFVGLDQTIEREEVDRTTLQLPGFQPELIDRIINVVAKPLVLVVVAGGCVDLSKYKEHPKVGAIVFAGYPGQAGGQAIAEVLFGATNPSARLTQTFYSEDFVKTTSIYDYHMRPHEPTGNPGRTYRFYRGSPVYEFGSGLSFTTFRVELRTSCSCQSSKPWRGKALVTVTNTGNIPGEFAALLFAKPLAADAGDRPLKSLIAFDRTRLLGAGESQSFTFHLSAKDFATADEHGEWKTQSGAWELSVDDVRVRILVSSKTGCIMQFMLDHATLV